MIFSKKLALTTILALTLSVMGVAAQQKITTQEYIAKYKNIAIDHMERYGIPASITLAQGILESDSGNSELSRKSNNHFGIKCKKDWKGGKVYHDDDAKGECFRSYKSVEESYEDHAEYLDAQPRYDSLFVYSSNDYRSWARGLKAAGYATNPKYAQLLVNIIEEHKLYEYDVDNGGRKPQTPAPASTEKLTRQEYVMRYMHIAIDHMERYGIPASITLAQGILESNCGNSQLSRESNNHFGIKCKKDWKGGKVYYDDDEKDECFRSYDSVEESYEDHANFLDQNARYDKLFTYDSDDYKSWAKGLKEAGYATNPQYATSLIKIIEEEKLYLLDRANGAKLYASNVKAEKGIASDFDAESNVSHPIMATSKIDPNNYRVAEQVVGGYSVYTNNHTPYIIAREGDTLSHIAQTFSLTESTLRKYNEMKSSGEIPLVDGEIIYVARKQNLWMGNARRHLVSENETLLSISQDYGIRLSKLAKMNKMNKDEKLQVGDEIKLKK